MNPIITTIQQLQERELQLLQLIDSPHPLVNHNDLISELKYVRGMIEYVRYGNALRSFDRSDIDEVPNTFPWQDDY